MGPRALTAADQPTKWAVMTENNPDGIGFGDGTVAGLEAAGYEVVAYEKFVEGTEGLLLDHPQVQGSRTSRASSS